MPDRLQPWREPVLPEWIDYNGHLSEAYYVLVFGHATDAVMIELGMTPEYLARTRTSLFTLEAHVRYLDQIGPDTALEVRPRVIGLGRTTVWLWHELFAGGRLRATEEVLCVHVDTRHARGVPFTDLLRQRLSTLCEEPPAEAGRRIEIR